MPHRGEAKPYSKAQQLARGERRYRRRVASPKQWAAIREGKAGNGKCRACKGYSFTVHLHHLVSRAQGGDDVADNLVPLCQPCHDAITRRQPFETRELLRRLTNAEYAYCITKAGEDFFERAYGLVYSRV